MHIKHIEVGNFRKLRAVRIDFAADKTVFVGANNSGKTSAMIALRRFLVDSSAFVVTDFTLSHWKELNEAADHWESTSAGQPMPPIDWNSILPFMDIWLHVKPSELHYVRKLVPSLDWSGGVLGVRLRYEPKDRNALQQEYLTARAQRASTLGAARATDAVAILEGGIGPVSAAIKTEAPEKDAAAKVEFKVALWPGSMIEFLERRMRSLFSVQAYLLDPSKLVKPVTGHAAPQVLGEYDNPIDGDPFKDLIAIDEISAQRGFGQTGAVRGAKDDEKSGGRQDNRGGRRLSAQLRSYYTSHLDPYDTPEPKDLDALHAMEQARMAFDDRLKEGFSLALKELESLGYPGVTDPKLTISTRIRPTDGLSHDSAVQYEVPTYAASASAPHRLPEDSNGLGYQNLVSMVFGLMSFRDAWMRVGKAGTSPKKAEESFIPPLHLVLVEEPEAHLHAQVQQVFIKQAYTVLRNHPKLGDFPDLTTQLIVSTHSSHVAHACDFASLRYFRRLPAPKHPSSVPIASVVNLSEVFGGADKTEQFVARYIKASHCDLFFADGVILVEGPAERILVPHFVAERSDYEFLRRCYLTWLEIGGSHAHRLRQLIEHLGITTLIITDLDAKAGDSTAALPPQRGSNQKIRNETLKTWIPAEEALDTLLDAKSDRKEKIYGSGFGVRVAYQNPVHVLFKETDAKEALANTFEDSLLYQNIPFFNARTGTGLIAKFSVALSSSKTLQELSEQVHAALKGGGKAEFALDLLYSDDLPSLVVPTYIHDGLLWLAEQLRRKEKEMIAPPVVNI